MMLICLLSFTFAEEVLFRKGCVIEKRKWKQMNEIGRERRRSLRKSGNAFWQKGIQIQMQSSRG
uniref:Uncharacterized protein n=1 Tax=Cebus imitator TaxID=2715852 RepID=A0A2K5PY18_CEBIM